jgi:hypothetical protein
MWLLNNTTPFAAERTWVQDKRANKIWLVIVKATFDIRPNGTCQLSGSQIPVFRMGEPTGELGKSSLRYEADLFGLKPSTDVLLSGSAWAPSGRRVGTVSVQMKVGSIHKTLRIFGERHWERGVIGAVISSSQPFESMPITYERAYGGWDRSSEDPCEHRLESRNPVGTGYALRVENCLGKVLPNIESPKYPIAAWDDRPPPAGFNAIDCAWSPRRELSGTYDQDWLVNRFPLWAEDFDEHYNNCAPDDQQIDGFLNGGEPVELTNLTSNGRLAFNLPRVSLVFRTRFGRERIDHEGKLCTVVLEPDAMRVIMVWQTSLLCNGQMDQLDETTIREANHF